MQALLNRGLGEVEADALEALELLQACCILMEQW